MSASACSPIEWIALRNSAGRLQSGIVSETPLRNATGCRWNSRVHDDRNASGSGQRPRFTCQPAWRSPY